MCIPHLPTTRSGEVVLLPPNPSRKKQKTADTGRRIKSRWRWKSVGGGGWVASWEYLSLSQESRADQLSMKIPRTSLKLPTCNFTIQGSCWSTCLFQNLSHDLKIKLTDGSTCHILDSFAWGNWANTLQCTQCTMLSQQLPKDSSYLSRSLSCSLPWVQLIDDTSKWVSSPSSDHC